jgi:hypothetical protein
MKIHVGRQSKLHKTGRFKLKLHLHLGEFGQMDGSLRCTGQEGTENLNKKETAHSVETEWAALLKLLKFVQGVGGVVHINDGSGLGVV